MFWRGFPSRPAREAAATQVVNGRKKILHESALSRISECLNFVFKGVGSLRATGMHGNLRGSTGMPSPLRALTPQAYDTAIMTGSLQPGSSPEVQIGPPRNVAVAVNLVTERNTDT